MLFTNIPIKLTAKDSHPTKFNLHFSYIRFTFPQKIADILLCLNGDDEQRYMHSIKSNSMNKKKGIKNLVDLCQRSNQKC